MFPFFQGRQARTAFSGLTALALGLAATWSIAQEKDAAVNSTEAPQVTSQTIRAIFEIVLKHHYEPPTRQQLIADFLKSYLRQQGQRPARELTDQLSALADVDALYQYLDATLQPLGLYEQNDALQKIMNVLGTVVGPIDIVPLREVNVSKQLEANRYVGIGIQVLDDMGIPQVTSVFETGTSYAAGLRSGDFIMTVDDQATNGVPLGTVVQWLRGPEGSRVKLGVKSPTSDKLTTMHIERKVVPIISVKQLPGSASVAIFQILRLASSNVDELTGLIEALPTAIDKVVIDFRALQDLRGDVVNGLHNAHLLADAVLDGGTLGRLETAGEVRKLTSAPGNILQGRELVLVYSPGASICIDWLVTAANGMGIRVYHQSMAQQPVGKQSVVHNTVEQQPEEGDWFYISDFVELDAESMLLLPTSRLSCDGSVLRKVPVGEPITDGVLPPL